MRDQIADRLTFDINIRTQAVLTHVVDDEALPFTEHQAGGVRVEGHREVRGRGGHLEGADAAHELAQDACGDLVPIQDGEHVTVADVQPGGMGGREGGRGRGGRENAVLSKTSVCPITTGVFGTADCLASSAVAAAHGFLWRTTHPNNVTLSLAPRQCTRRV